MDKEFLGQGDLTISVGVDLLNMLLQVCDNAEEFYKKLPTREPRYKVSIVEGGGQELVALDDTFREQYYNTLDGYVRADPILIGVMGIRAVVGVAFAEGDGTSVFKVTLYELGKFLDTLDSMEKLQDSLPITFPIMKHVEGGVVPITDEEADKLKKESESLRFLTPLHASIIEAKVLIERALDSAYEAGILKSETNLEGGHNSDINGQ
jgi:hypothetical protein